MWQGAFALQQQLDANASHRRWGGAGNTGCRLCGRTRFAAASMVGRAPSAQPHRRGRKAGSGCGRAKRAATSHGGTNRALSLSPAGCSPSSAAPPAGVQAYRPATAGQRRPALPGAGADALPPPPPRGILPGRWSRASSICRISPPPRRWPRGWRRWRGRGTPSCSRGRSGRANPPCPRLPARRRRRSDAGGALAHLHPGAVLRPAGGAGTSFRSVAAVRPGGAARTRLGRGACGHRAGGMARPAGPSPHPRPCASLSPPARRSRRDAPSCRAGRIGSRSCEGPHHPRRWRPPTRPRLSWPPPASPPPAAGRSRRMPGTVPTRGWRAGRGRRCCWMPAPRRGWGGSCRRSSALRCPGAASGGAWPRRPSHPGGSAGGGVLARRGSRPAHHGRGAG